MRRPFLAALLALTLGIAACESGDGDAMPTLDTAGSGAPLNPGGVGPAESQEPIDDE